MRIGSTASAKATRPGAAARSEPLRRAIGAVRRVLARAGALSLFVNLLALAGPLYMLQIYDRVLSSRSLETLAVITLLTLALFAAMAMLDFARGALVQRAARSFDEALRAPAFDLALDAARAGAAAPEQPLKDLRRLRQFAASPALIALFDAPWTPIYLLIVFLMHPLLGLVAVAGLLVLVALAAINERRSRGALAEAQGRAGEADRAALAAMRNAAAADAMGMRGALRGKWTALSDGAEDRILAAADVSGALSAASRASRVFLQSAILCAGAVLAIRNEATPGVMIAASIIAGRALAPVEAATTHWKTFFDAAAAFARLDRALAFAPSDRVRTALPPPRGALLVNRLACQPGGAKKPVLKGVSFALAPGEALGVVGPSAAGKSTLALAIVGVERAASGEVRLDGADITQWDADALGRHIGFLPQEVELFAGTAAENIARFSADAQDAEIIAAARAAGAHDMILALPDGYDTDIGDRGRRLSAGQRQRLGLARALFRDPALVVLDEPNANLDAEGEAALAEAVKALKARGATTIIVAHRPSAIAFVDKLLMLADGEMRAFGPRDEILARIAPKQVAPFKRAAPEGPGEAGGEGAANG